MQISAALKLIALIPSCSIHKMLVSFSGVEFKDCIEIKEKKSCHLVFTFSTRCKMRHFHIIVVQLQQRNVQKRCGMWLQKCCFANVNLLLFLCSCCHRHYLSSLWLNYSVHFLPEGISSTGTSAEPSSLPLLYINRLSLGCCYLSCIRSITWGRRLFKTKDKD